MIPAELRALPQWVAWRVETRDGKPTKVPYDAKRPQQRASSTDPATWAAYREALAVLDSDGLGFVFTADDPYVGVDLDGCVSANGALHPAAHEVVEALGGYVEFSPSGTGLHIVVRGTLKRGRHTLKTPWDDELAVYDRGRFFTMLGNGRGEICDAQDALDTLVARYFPTGAARPPVSAQEPFSDDDEAVLARLLSDPQRAALWGGETAGHGGDHSAADLALCNHLAYFTGNDVVRVDALFRRSGLARDKWDEPRGDSTYGRMTIERALRGDGS